MSDQQHLSWDAVQDTMARTRQTSHSATMRNGGVTQSSNATQARVAQAVVAPSSTPGEPIGRVLTPTNDDYAAVCQIVGEDRFTPGCFWCGTAGHKWNVCPEKRAGKSQNDEGRKQQSEFTKAKVRSGRDNKEEYLRVVQSRGSTKASPNAQSVNQVVPVTEVEELYNTRTASAAEREVAEFEEKLARDAMDDLHY